MAKNVDWAALARKLQNQYASAPGLRTDPARYQVRREVADKGYGQTSRSDTPSARVVQDVARKTRNPVAQAATTAAHSVGRRAGDVSQAVHAAQQAAGQGTGRGAVNVVANPPLSTLAQAAQQVAQGASGFAGQSGRDGVNQYAQSLTDISNSPWAKRSYDNAMPNYANGQPGYANARPAYDNLGSAAGHQFRRVAPADARVLGYGDLQAIDQLG